MSSEAAFETIRDYLIANWTTTPLIFENEEYQTADNPTAFVFVEIWGDFFDQASIGSGAGHQSLA
jgi:hypothetical protein